MNVNPTITVPAVSRQLEAGSAAAHIGASCVLTLVSTQAARVVPALVDVWNTKDTTQCKTMKWQKILMVVLRVINVMEVKSPSSPTHPSPLSHNFFFSVLLQTQTHLFEAHLT